MATVTRTTNPIHFEDLEPHRFEDLVRQLIYDLKDWSRIEGTGRAGSDDGFDIRAWERLPGTTPKGEGASEDDGEGDGELAPQERLWMIQCKREKTINPAKVKKIVRETFDAPEEKPKAYALIAACDFSKAARDALRTEMVERKVEEHFIWGRSELEDLLFLPKNDHLLFAYFGISLQVRRRSLRADTSRVLTLKRKLVKVLGDIRGTHHMDVLIRDPKDTTYPEIDDLAAFKKKPRWKYLPFVGHTPPGHVAFICRQRFAWIKRESKEWDVVSGLDAGGHSHEIYGLKEPYERDERYLKVYAFWNSVIPRHERAWMKELCFIPYERIYALDEIGDAYHPGPHLLVDFLPDGQPFEPFAWYTLDPDDRYSEHIGANKELRRHLFPDPIPDPPAEEKPTA